MTELKEKLTQMLEASVAKGEVAGANLLILKDGKEIAYAQAGYADKEAGRTYDRNTIFRMYSMTKPITGAAAMILLERGQLDLGQAVGEILPSFQNQMVWENGTKVPVHKNMMVKDLLSMTSGLSYGGTDQAGKEMTGVLGEINDRLYSEAPLTTMEIAEKIGACGLSYHPGDKWMYGTSADVMAAVIEKISGKRFGDFLKKEIFEPLGMHDTAFYVPEDKRDRLAVVYESTPDGVKEYQTNHLGIKYTLDKDPAFQSGGAGLVSTLDDYAKFATMLLNGGTYEGRQILRPATVKFFTTGKLTPFQQEYQWRTWARLYGFTYGNLMRVMEEPGMAYLSTWKGEYGWDGWLGSYFANSPSNKVTVLLSMQKKDGGNATVTRSMRSVLAAYLD